MSPRNCVIGFPPKIADWNGLFGCGNLRVDSCISASNCCRIGTELKDSHSSGTRNWRSYRLRKGAVKALGQECDGELFAIVKAVRLGQNIENLGPIERTWQNFRGARRHSIGTVGKDRIVCKYGSTNSRIAHNHESLSFGQVRPCARRRFNRAVDLLPPDKLGLIIDSEAISSSPEFRGLRIVCHNSFGRNGRQSKSRRIECLCFGILDEFGRLAARLEYLASRGSRSNAVGRTHLNGTDALRAGLCPSQKAASDVGKGEISNRVIGIDLIHLGDLDALENTFLDGRLLLVIPNAVGIGIERGIRNPRFGRKLGMIGNVLKIRTRLPLENS